MLKPVALAPQRGVLPVIRSLGIVRVAFIACFFVLYGALLLYSFVGGDPHERYRVQARASGDGFSAEMLSNKRASTAVFMDYAPPSRHHLLGTDEQGRDLLLRLAHGARTSLATGLTCLFTFLVAGIGFGVVSGYFEGNWRRVLVFLFNLVNTFPILLFLLLAVIIIDGTVHARWPFLRVSVLMLLLGLFSSPKLAELIKGRIASLKEATYIQASQSLGLSPAQIILKHILWYECRPLIIVQGAYMMGQAILVETTLTYLNFGVEYPLISWGLMLRTMVPDILAGRHQGSLPVMGMIALSVFFYSYLAALLNDLLEPGRGKE